MRLREFIEKKTPDELRGELIKAIDLANDTEEMKKVMTLITSAFKELDNEDFIFIQQHFDKKISNMRL